MAARQDQTNTIIISIAGVLIFLLSGLAYWNGSQWAKEFARAEELQAQKSQADSASRTSIGEAETLRQMIGFEPSAPIADIEAQFEKDKDQYMSTFDEASRAYRSVLDYIYAENSKISQQENAAKQSVKELQQKLVSVEDESAKQIAAASAAADAAKRDLASERSSFEQARANIEKQKRRLTQTIARKEAEFQQRLNEANTARDEAQNLVAKNDRSLKSLLAERSRESPTFEVADGQITYVNQATGVAWIDVGTADALRNQVTFSVFESDLSDAGKAEKKGSLEVTRLLGDHLAEARITSDDPQNPILPGDNIYSQVWQRGRELRFALTGLVDLDGDGESDLLRAKDLIALNGAVVDSSLEEDGSIDGEMTANTRYLVLGVYPDAPSKGAYRDGYNRMQKEASRVGVETITLTEFLSQMGYREQQSAVSFRANTGTRSGAPTNFRYRTP
ncbi:MAG: hypothetical protein AAF805_00365 [Planctomycetota bacterium]